uniref:Reticulon-like protein n=1 Tax=Culex tarsalis TaxID=7177 RepID=A0A1Q3G472_CULTA
MDSFLVDSDPVIPKDLGEMPKEQQKFDLIADDDDSHSRFMAAEKSDSSQKFPTEVTDLLGDSFAMSNPVPVPPAATAAHDNRDLFHDKDNFDDFFMKSAEEKKNPEPAAFAPSSLIDIGGEPDFFGAQKKPTVSAVDDFEDANPADDLTKVKDTIESDYMNPYAEVRSNPAKKVEEPPLVVDPPAAAASAKDDDIFNDFSSHQTAAAAAKPDQFSEPMFDDSPPTPPVVAPKVTPAPAPEPVVPSVVTTAAPKPADPPQEKPKPAPTPVVTEKNQPKKTFKQEDLKPRRKTENSKHRVESLIYWRDVKKSGIVFGSGLSVLIAMSLFSLISVFSYVSLLVLFGTVSFRIYKNVLQAVQKTAEGHPFKEYLDFDLTLSQEKVQQLTTVAVAHVNALLSELRRLFLVEDLVDSIKFGVVLYCLTYVGAIFNGMTCVIIAFIALFTLPKVYENNKQSIDAYLELVRSKILEITEKVKAAVPLGKKVEADKEK